MFFTKRMNEIEQQLRTLREQWLLERLKNEVREAACRREKARVEAAFAALDTLGLLTKSREIEERVERTSGETSDQREGGC